MEVLPEWMKRFVQQDLDEEQEPLSKLLEPRARNFIWWLCKEYKFMENGVMGQACSLLERYMAKKSLNLFYTAPRLLLKRIRVNHDIACRIPLLASVCVALTTKMMSSEDQLDAPTIRKVLSSISIYVTLDVINSTELDVLVTLGFRIPMFTNVEKAMMLAVDVGLSSPSLLEGVALVTDIAEYYRSDIQKEVIRVAFSIRADKDEHLLRAQGFRIPMFTNVEKAMMLAVDVGLSSPSLLEGVALVTDIAEYYRSDIQKEVIRVAFSIRADKDEHLLRAQAITNVRHIHLVAGAVSATHVYLRHGSPDPVPRLCFLTQANSLYMKCIGNIIYKRLVRSWGPRRPIREHSNEEPSTSKRKRSED